MAVQRLGMDCLKYSLTRDLLLQNSHCYRQGCMHACLGRKQNKKNSWRSSPLYHKIFCFIASTSVVYSTAGGLLSLQLQIISVGGRQKTDIFMCPYIYELPEKEAQGRPFLIISDKRSFFFKIWAEMTSWMRQTYLQLLTQDGTHATSFCIPNEHLTQNK